MVLVRHGDTEWSRCGRHTGRTDVPLVPEGREQARRLAGLLAPWSFALVLSSPLSRALETAALAGYPDPEIIDELSEWDYGEYEGRTSAEICRERPGWTLWSEGVPGGETASAVGARADRVIERAQAVEGDTLCFAHGHVLRVLAARWVGLPPIGGRFLALGTASLSVLGWERGARVLALWNQRAPAPDEAPGH